MQLSRCSPTNSLTVGCYYFFLAWFSFCEIQFGQKSPFVLFFFVEVAICAFCSFNLINFVHVVWIVWIVWIPNNSRKNSNFLQITISSIHMEEYFGLILQPLPNHPHNHILPQPTPYPIPRPNHPHNHFLPSLLSYHSRPNIMLSFLHIHFFPLSLLSNFNPNFMHCPKLLLMNSNFQRQY